MADALANMIVVPAYAGTRRRSTQDAGFPRRRERLPPCSRWIAFALIAALPACAAAVETAVVARATSIDPAVVRRLFELDPEHVSGRDVAEVLAHIPAPRIILIQGSFAPFTMEPFAQFLIAMGYPEERLRNPRNGGHSAASFADSAQLAGALAWYYESEGVRPLMIGHSQGGMLAIRVLYEFTGAYADAIAVWDPVTDSALPRTAIIDPLSGALRPVVGLTLPYVAAIATGKLPRILLGQWTMLPKLRRIPDSAEEFTGFALEGDLVAGEWAGAEPYTATGSALVRNVTLPATYTHVGLPVANHLATDAVVRAWIETYTPGETVVLPDARNIDTTNLIHAADIWHSVKKHWCLEARRLVTARQGDR